jgi:hypothetical protein
MSGSGRTVPINMKRDRTAIPVIHFISMDWPISAPPTRHLAQFVAHYASSTRVRSKRNWPQFRCSPARSILPPLIFDETFALCLPVQHSQATKKGSRDHERKVVGLTWLTCCKKIASIHEDTRRAAQACREHARELPCRRGGDYEC